jgi:hypothetical protein
MAILNAIAGKDLHLRECVARQVNAMKHELSGDAPSALEKLAIERIVTAFLQLSDVEIREVQHPEESPKWAKFAAERQERANRQLFQAMNALSNLRKAAKTITVEVQQQVVVPPAMPIIEKHAHGEDGVAAGATPRAAASVNGSGKPVNRLNGHANRISGVLEPSTAQ